MNSGKIVADGTGGRVDGTSKVLQEVLADLKKIYSELKSKGDGWLQRQLIIGWC